MDFGEMDTVITIQESAGTVDAYNQTTRSWSNISVRPKMYAAYWTDKGKEDFEAAQKTATEHKVWKVHWRNDLDYDMTIVDPGGKRWDITNIREVKRKRNLLIETTWTQGKYDS